MKICVLGCGAYGSALSIILNENGNQIVGWVRDENKADSLNRDQLCLKLPGVKLPSDILYTSDIQNAVENADFILVAVPTEFVAETLKKAKPYIGDIPICVACKGIEQDSCLFASQIVESVLNTDNVAVISGPSFAVDVANKVPVGLTLACQNKKTTDMIIEAFVNDHFKLRVTGDIIGSEICGSIKNVVAIAAGIINGLGMPESTSAMFITESLHDIKALIKGLGGNGDTILSFAGFGDLLLTSTSSKSRNFSFGYLIGNGASKEKIDDYIANTTIEGLYTLKSIRSLIVDKNVDMPIIELIYEIIYCGKKPEDLIRFLIEKP